MNRNRLMNLVEDALSQPETERASWLKDACDGDLGLYDEAMSLIAADAIDTGRFEFQSEEEDADDLSGVTIGAWRLTSELGKGGMGSVWLAERADGEVRMRAAIKVIKAELASPELLSRFRRERQIMADLNHPHIGVLYDAGTTQDGRPYLVMEYVDGDVIDRYCDDRKLSRKARVSLFKQVCDAVRFAHRRGVIHRDIKPPNIMVSEEGVVKLMDFGIAIMDTVDEDLSDITRPGQMIMTPEYASPEQLRGQAAGVSSDLYSLALVLCRLVTGKRPRDLGGNPVRKLNKLLKDDDDTMMGGVPYSEDEITLISDVKDENLEDPLFDILAKALDPEKYERYEAVQDLMDDLEAYLSVSPGSSTPVRALYDAMVWCSTSDMEQVETLIENLEHQHQLRLWLEWRQTAPGVTRDRAYSRALSDSVSLVVIRGEDDPWDDENILAALEEELGNRQVIPILLPGLQRPERESDLPRFLRRKTWIKITHEADPDELEQIAITILGETREVVTQEPIAICPFKGLEVFNEEDARFFYGRDGVTQRLVDHMRAHHFLAVLGPSGSGKSSVVQAGLIPRLREDGVTPVLFTPTASPLEELAFALYRLLPEDGPQIPPEQILGRLTAGEGALHFLIREIREIAGLEKICLIIDQFEEIFTLAKDAKETGQFLAGLLYAVERKGPLSAALTLRSDFVGKCVIWPDLSSFLLEHAIQVEPMNREELSQAISEPARLAGLRFEEGLVPHILDDVVGAPGELPLLEHALFELWERRRGRMLTASAYAEIGGIQGALARRAESVYEDLDSPARQVLRKMFTLCLVNPGEGSEDTRRRATRSEILNVGGDQKLAESLLIRLTEARLLTGYRDELQDVDQVDVAHEALIRRWERVKIWMDEDRESSRQIERLRRQARAWHEANRDADYLLRGGPLYQMKDLLDRERDHLGEQEQDFVSAGMELQEREKHQREETIRHLREAEQRTRMEKERAEQKTLEANYNLCLAFSKDAATALEKGKTHEAWLLSLAALSLDIPANKRLPEAHGRFMDPRMSEAGKMLWTSPIAPKLVRAVTSHDGLLLALAGQDGAIRLLDTQTGVQSGLMSKAKHNITDMTFSPDGKWLGAASDRNAVYLWNVKTGEANHFQGIHKGYVGCVAFSSESDMIATGGDDGRVHIRHLNNMRIPISQSMGSPITCLTFCQENQSLYLAAGNELFRLDTVARGLEQLELNGVLSIASIPGKIVCGLENGHISFIDLKSGEKITRSADHPGPVTLLATSPDHSQLISSSSHDIVSWDCDTAQPGSSFPIPPVANINLDPYGRITGCRKDGLLLRLHVDDGATLPTPRGHLDTIWSMAISSDGETFASGSNNGYIVIWSLSGDTTPRFIRAHRGQVSDLAFSPDGKCLASASADHSVKIWDVAKCEKIKELMGHASKVYCVAFSPDGKQLASGSGDKTILLWDLATSDPIGKFIEKESHLASLAFSPDGKMLAASSDNQSVKLWVLSLLRFGSRTNADGGLDLPYVYLRGHSSSVTAVAFSPDGSLLASSSRDTTVTIYSLGSNTVLKSLRGHTADVWHLAFSPDGAFIASASADQTVILWDISSGDVVFSYNGHSGNVMKVGFTPDSSRIISVSEDQTVKLWDVDLATSVHVLEGHDARVNDVAFFAEGARLASASFDRTVRLWDTHSGVSIQTLSDHPAPVWGVAYSENGMRIASSCEDQVARTWSLKSIRSVNALKDNPSSGFGISYSPDGSCFASGLWDSTVKVIDSETGEVLKTLAGHRGPVYGVAFSPDGARIASASDDGDLRMWDLATGECINILMGHTGHVYDAAFSPDGQILASASEDHTIRLWSVSTGEPLDVLTGHSARTFGVDYSPDGQWLASSSIDGAVRIWEALSGRPIAVLIGHEGPVNWIAFSPDGSLLATTSHDKTIRLWHMDRMLQPPADQDSLAWYRELLDRSLYFLGYRLDGIQLIPQPRTRLFGAPGELEPGPYDHLDRPRPSGVDLAEWLMQGYQPSPKDED